MAQAANFDEKSAKRFTRSQHKKRRQDVRKKIVYFLIGCEGEKTEPNYFRSFSKDVKTYVYEITAYGEGRNTLSLIDDLIERKKNLLELSMIGFGQYLIEITLLPDCLIMQ